MPEVYKYSRQVNITQKYPYHKKIATVLFYGGFMLGWV